MVLNQYTEPTSLQSTSHINRQSIRQLITLLSKQQEVWVQQVPFIHQLEETQEVQFMEPVFLEVVVVALTWVELQVRQ